MNDYLSEYESRVLNLCSVFVGVEDLLKDISLPFTLLPVVNVVGNRCYKDHKQKSSHCSQASEDLLLDIHTIA